MRQLLSPYMQVSDLRLQLQIRRPRKCRCCSGEAADGKSMCWPCFPSRRGWHIDDMIGCCDQMCQGGLDTPPRKCNNSTRGAVKLRCAIPNGQPKTCTTSSLDALFSGSISVSGLGLIGEGASWKLRPGCPVVCGSRETLSWHSLRESFPRHLELQWFSQPSCTMPTCLG